MKTATWFHCQLKPMSRSAGKSVVNCAAYRTGSKLEDVHYGQTRDYTHKKDVVTSFTLAPDGAPAWASDTESLWNAVEKKENRKNSILSYEWEVALPNELDDAERENITRNIAAWLRDEYGVAVTAGIHNGGDRGSGENVGKNDHAHIFMTTRAFSEGSEDGWAKNKLRDFNVRPGQDNPNVEHVREQVATFINAALDDAGSDERVTHESYAARGIDIEGTKHLGPKTCALQRDGHATDRSRINEGILAARAAVEARLVWQQEQAQPEITEQLEQEFSARFDDWQPITRGETAPAADPFDTTPAAQDAASAVAAEPENRPDVTPEPEAAPGEVKRVTPWVNAFRVAAARARAIWDDLHSLWEDEGGAPTQQPEAQAPEATSAAPKSFAERVMENRAVRTGLRFWHGWSHRDGGEMIAAGKEAATEAGEFLKARIFPTGDPRGGGDEDAFRDAVKETVAEGPRHPAAEIARRRAEAESNGDGSAATGNLRDRAGSVWRDERGSVPATDPDAGSEPAASPEPTIPANSKPPIAKPMTAFERLAARTTAPEAPSPKPMTAFDRLAAEYLASLNRDEAAEPDDQPPPPPNPAQGLHPPQGSHPSQGSHGPDIDID